MATIKMPATNTSMFKLIQHLTQQLFTAEHRRLDKAIARLITRHLRANRSRNRRAARPLPRPSARAAAR